MSIIRTISSRHAERGRMSGDGSLWQIEQRALTSSSVATGRAWAPGLAAPEVVCRRAGLAVPFTWRAAASRTTAARIQPDGRDTRCTIRVYASDANLLGSGLPTPETPLDGA